MVSKLVSTRDVSRKEISYADALLKGLAPDGGLYFPSTYPKFSESELEDLRGKDYVEIAFAVKKKFVEGSIPDKDLKRLISSAYGGEKFSAKDGNIVPVTELYDGLFKQNLSLGPTAAFKDMALQQLGQEFQFELGKRDEKLVILGATSGDTGSAAEAAVKGLDNVILFMLSPQNRMSGFQKAQMGELSGGNIFNVGIDGTFDDCQDLVKTIKMDDEFANLGAVNSINWGRISSQVPYFVSGWLQASSKVGEVIDFSVPTGNFGDILSGYVAKRMGVPIGRLNAATNENDIVHRLIQSGVYEKFGKSEQTSSPSMDIVVSSNYERLMFQIVSRNPGVAKDYMDEFKRTGKVSFLDYGINPKVLDKIGFDSDSSTHEDRLDVISQVYIDSGVIIDPHTADGLYTGFSKKRDNIPMVVMETALPVKFEETIGEALGFVPERDERFRGLEARVGANSFHNMDNDAEMLKQYIRDNS